MQKLRHDAALQSFGERLRFPVGHSAAFDCESRLCLCSGLFDLAGRKSPIRQLACCSSRAGRVSRKSVLAAAATQSHWLCGERVVHCSRGGVHRSCTYHAMYGRHRDWTVCVAASSILRAGFMLGHCLPNGPRTPITTTTKTGVKLWGSSMTAKERVGTAAR